MGTASEIEGRSLQHVASFQRDGYFVLENALSPEQIAALQAETDAIIDNPPLSRVGDILRSGYLTNWGVFSDHIWGVDQRGPTLAGLLTDESVRLLASQLARTDVRPQGLSMQVMYARCGCKQPWHQDHTPGDPELWWINCVYYLTDMTEDNGSLLVLPESQHEPLDRRLPDYGPLPRSRRITCAAGSAVFFPNGLLHAVDENRSDQVRRALKVNYVPSALDLFGKMHEQRYSRGIRRGDGPIAARPRPTGSHWFA